MARGRLEARLDRLLAWPPTDADNRKLAAHRVSERDALFSFLSRPEVPATNWAAEQAIRRAVVPHNGVREQPHLARHSHPGGGTMA